MTSYLHSAGASAAIALVASAVALAQTDVATGGADGMISNAMIPGFDPVAGLRAAQASRDPVRRTEVFARPGDTRLELQSDGHRTRVTLHTIRLPANLDGAEWPSTAIVGSYNPAVPYALTNIDVRVDGCVIEMPVSGIMGFSDPRRASLTREEGLWKLEVWGSDSDEAYALSYRFDGIRVVAEHIEWGGSYDARWKISQDDYGEGRDCEPVGPRRFGSRAEPKAAPRR